MDFPSLYRQVAEDSKTIKNIVESLDPDNNGGFGKNVDDGYFVSGLKIITTLMTENSPPTTYKIGVSYEVKAISAIGLDATAGFLDENCLVVTYRYSNTSNTAMYITPFQVAYNSSMTAYGRKALDASDGWDAWVIISGGGSGGTDFLESVVKPVGQQVGSFWTQSVSTLEGYKNGGLTPYSYVTIDNTVDGGVHVMNTSISSIIIDKLYGNTVNNVSVDSPITLKVSKNPSTDQVFDGYTYNIYLIASDIGTYPNPLSLSKNDTVTDTLELDRTINQWVVIKRVGKTNPVTILLNQDTQEYLNCLYATAGDSYLWFDNIVKPTMEASIPRGAYSMHPDVFRLLQSSFSRELQSKIVMHIGDTSPNENQYLWFDTSGYAQDDPSMFPVSTITSQLAVSEDEPTRVPSLWFHITSIDS